MVAADERWNGARFDPTSRTGHYESWFVRANGPRRRAFWIRYTIFSPRARPQDAVGELWAITFEADEIVAVKEQFPISECSFAPDRLSIAIGEARLDGDSLRGRASANGHTIAWDLNYGGGGPPVFLLAERLYPARLPRAKTLVNQPMAIFTGSVVVDGNRLEIAGWVGSQNHNWGPRHTDRYAWGQVAGFDEEAAAFLECSTARLKIGPLWTPPLTLVVLRLGGETFAFNGLARAVRASGTYEPFNWQLATGDDRARIAVRIEGNPRDFVALKYPNPPGGTKICLNSKIARCELTLQWPDSAPVALHSSGAAFEILDDVAPPGMSPVV